MKTIVVATNNQHKVDELAPLFPSVRLLSLKDIGYVKPILENGRTFEENALLKARQVAKDLGYSVLADDSGLEVEALQNAPGIYSARYAQKGDDRSNNALLIENLKGIANRKARFVCVLCICQPDGKHRFFKGICEGEVIDEARGSNGFGYDPHFYIPQLGKTFAEMTLEEKNTLSHRKKAYQKMKEQCNEDLSFK